MRNTYGSTLSSAGQQSLQGYTQFVNFNSQGLAILGEKSLPAQTYRISIEFAPERNRLQYVKGMMDYRRKSGGINDGPYLLNYLNRKRNVEKMRQRVLEEIQDRIYQDKYYIEDYNVKDQPRNSGRSKSMLHHKPSRNNSISFQPILEEEESQMQSQMEAPSRGRESRGHQTSRRNKKTQTIQPSNEGKTRRQSERERESQRERISQKQSLRKKEQKAKKDNDSWSEKSSDEEEKRQPQLKTERRSQRQSQLQSRKQYNPSHREATRQNQSRQDIPSRSFQSRQQQMSKYSRKQLTMDRSQLNGKPQAPESEDEW